MKFRYLVLIIIFLFPFAAIKAQTADEILAKYFSAAGIGNYGDVNSIVITGKITSTSLKNNAVLYTIKKVRPFKQYMELTGNGKKSETVFDGRSEWIIAGGKNVKNPFDVEELRKRKICFEGELFYLKNNGYKIEYSGISKIDGLDFYTLTVTGKDDLKISFYIDPGSYMLMKSVEGDLATYYSNFKNIEGVTIPFSIRIASLQSGESTENDIETIEFNKEVNPNLFVR